MRIISIIFICFLLSLWKGKSVNCQAISTSPCVTNFGSKAECIDVTKSQCNKGLSLTAKGFCPGSENIQCCANFQLLNAAISFDGTENPWQKAAAESFQSVLSKYPELLKSFSCAYRGLTPSPDKPFCGSPIALSNALYFFSDLPNQRKALENLDSAIQKWTNVEHIQAWFTFISKFRDLPKSDSNSNSPTDPETTSPCQKKPASSWTLNENGLNLITHFEGWYSCCYVDSVGVWTVGYGHACHVNNDPDGSGNGCLGNNRCRGCISRQTGKALLQKDMAKFEKCVKDNVKVEVTSNQFAAMVSFAFNVGCNGFQTSTFLRLLNSRQLTPTSAQSQLTRWHSGCLGGLIRRRYAEAELFNSCSNSFPCSSSGCQISYGFNKCAGTCSHCGSCISCSSSTLSFQSDSSFLSNAFQSLGYNTALDQLDCQDSSYSGMSCASDEQALDQSSSYKCSSTVGSESIRSTCDEVEDLIPNLTAARSSGSGSINICTPSTPNVKSSLRVIRLDSWKSDALARINRTVNLPSNRFRVQLTVVKAPEGHQPTIVIHSLTPTTKSANISVFTTAQTEIIPQDSEAGVDGDISALIVDCANDDKDCTPPYSWDDRVEVSSAAPSHRSSDLMMFAAASAATAGLVSLTSSSPSPLSTSAVAVGAGLLTFASLPSTSAQSSSVAACVAFVNISILLSPYDYSTTVSLIQNGDISVNTLDIVSSSKSGQIPEESLSTLCSDPLTFSQLTVCNNVKVSNEVQIMAASIPAPITLTDLPKFYNPSQAPHQRCALDFLQSNTQLTRAYQDFSCAFRQRSWSSADPNCGSILKFSDAVTTIQKQTGGAALPHQTNAFTKFQRSLEVLNSNILSRFTEQWRNQQVCIDWKISRDGRCDNGNDVGCDPSGANPCCSPAGWCGISAGHCECTTCKDYRKYWTTKPGNTGGATTPAPGTPKTLTGNACTANHPVTGKVGVCVDQTVCRNAGGVTATSLCPNDPANVLCCSGDLIIPDFPKQDSLPGLYGQLQTFSLQGNTRSFTLVKVPQAHLTDPSAFLAQPTDRDNSINVDIVTKWEQMRSTAASSGVRILISSAFRSYKRQQYFYNCYRCQCCNGGNEAAPPGTSNHGNGIALDLNTDCGRQSSSSPPSLCTSGSAVYRWLRSNAGRFGFIRTVRSEPWHWEYRPGSQAPSYQ